MSDNFCRKCGAAVRWVRDVKTKRPLQLNLDPDRQGDVLLGEGSDAHVVSGAQAHMLLHDGADLYRQHRFTCGRWTDNHERHREAREERLMEQDTRDQEERWR